MTRPPRLTRKPLRVDAVLAARPAPRRQNSSARVARRRRQGIGHRARGSPPSDVRPRARAEGRDAHGRAHRRRHRSTRPSPTSSSRSCPAALDDREIALRQQNRAFFQISGAGHEALLLGLARSLRAGVRLVLPLLPRPRARARARRHARTRCCCRRSARPTTPRRADGRCRATGARRDLNIVSQTSCTGSQCLPAVGCAEAARYIGRRPTSRAAPRTATSSPTCRSATARRPKASSGSRSTPRAACTSRCSTSSPTTATRSRCGSADQAPGADLGDGARHPRPAHREDGRPRLLRGAPQGRRRDRARARRRRAVSRARARDPPVLALALRRPEEVPRRRRARRRSRARSDRRARARAHRTRRAHRSSGSTRCATRRDETRARRGRGRARRRRSPHPRSRARPRRRRRRRSPTMPAEPTPTPDAPLGHVRRGDPAHAARADGARRTHPRVRRGRRRRRSRTCIDEVPGKGGVFGITFGLQREFGDARCFNTPLAEANIIGRAVGQAMRGLRPCAEIQFFDYVWPAMNQLQVGGRHDALALERRVHAARWSCASRSAATSRAARSGTASRGESIFAHVPGLLIAFPSRARDAAGLLRTAFRMRGPGAVPRAQAPLPPGLQPRSDAAARLDAAVRPRHLRDARRPRHRRHVGRDRAPRPARGAGARRRRRASRSSTCARSRRGTARSSPSRCARPAACSCCTRTRSRAGSARRSRRSSPTSASSTSTRRCGGCAAADTLCAYEPDARERDPPAGRRHRPRPRSAPRVLATTLTRPRTGRGPSARGW